MQKIHKAIMDDQIVLLVLLLVGDGSRLAV